MSPINAEAWQHLDALLALPELDLALPSPDGRWVAWTWSGLSDTTDVFAVPTDGSAPPVRLTASDQNAWTVAWAPDSQSVLVAQDENGNERAQLFRASLAAPGEMTPLTEPRPSCTSSKPPPACR